MEEAEAKREGLGGRVPSQTLVVTAGVGLSKHNTKTRASPSHLSHVVAPLTPLTHAVLLNVSRA